MKGDPLRLLGFKGQEGPPGPKPGTSLIGQERRSKMKIEERPADEITMEEMRFDLAARVGAYRLPSGKSRLHILVENVPVAVMIGKGKNMLPTFVRVEIVDGFDPCFIALSTQLSSSSILTRTISEYVDVVVKAGEILFATAHQVPAGDNITHIKVTEVIV